MTVMNLSQRAHPRELLDEEGIPFDDIRKNMQELESINTWLGGHAITLAGIRTLLGDRKELHICEIGCGGGDNLKAIARWCGSKNIRLRLTGIDIKETCIEYAGQNLRGYGAELIASDYREAVLTSRPDIIFSSLFCHHFTDEQVAQILRWKEANAGLGYFINDLHRHPLAYHSIRVITGLFSSSYLVRHDAPVSVTRGFRRKDWENIIHLAGLSASASIEWRWAFRWLLCFRK